MMLRRRVDVVGVQILHLRLGDLRQRRTLDLSGRNLARLLRARLQVGGLLDQIRRRRRFRFEREAAIGIDGDHGRDRRSLLKLARRGVECLAEFHDVDAALTQSRADRGRRIGGAGGHLQLDIAGNLLCHCTSLTLSSGWRTRQAVSSLAVQTIAQAISRGTHARHPFFVMLNLFQHPCATDDDARAADDRAWTLKRVQGDDELTCCARPARNQARPASRGRRSRR